MPTIKRYSSQAGSANLRFIGRRRASASDFSQGGSFDQAAKGLKSVAQVLQKQKAREDTSAASQLLVDEQLNISKDIAAMREQAPLGADGHTQQVSTYIDQRIEDVVGRSPQSQQDTVRKKLLQMKAVAVTNAVSFQSQSSAKKRSHDFRTGLDKVTEMAVASPDDWNAVEFSLNNLGMNLTDSEKAQLMPGSKDTVGAAMFNAKISGASDSASMAALQDELTAKDSPWSSRMNAKDYQKALSGVASEVQRYSRIEKDVLRAKYSENVTAAMASGQELQMTKKDFLSTATNEAAKPVMERQYDTAAAVSQAIRDYAKMDDAQRVADMNAKQAAFEAGLGTNAAGLPRQEKVISALNGLYGPGMRKRAAEADAAQRAYNQRRKDIELDSAAVALRDDKTRKLWDDSYAWLSDGGDQSDQRAASFGKYVARIDDFNKTEKVQYQYQRLLPKDFHTNLKAISQDLETKDPQVVIGRIATEIARFGPAAPRVLSELEREGTLTPTQIGAARNPGAVGVKILEGHNIPAKDRKANKTAVEGAVTQAFTNLGINAAWGSETTRNTAMRNASGVVEDLTYAYVSDGVNATDAAELATKQYIGDKLNVVTINSSAARDTIITVPKSIAPEGSRKLSDITDGVTRLRQTIKASDVVVPGDWVGSSSITREEDFAGAVNMNGYAVNSPDGVVMMYHGNVVSVKDPTSANGRKPYGASFKELEALGVASLPQGEKIKRRHMAAAQEAKQ